MIMLAQSLCGLLSGILKTMGQTVKGYIWTTAIVLTLLAVACVPLTTPVGIPETIAVPTPTLLVTLSPTAAELVFRRNVNVYADRGWQDTDIFVNCGDQVTVRYISGEWTHWLGQIPYSDASGRYGDVCADSMPADECVEPIPDFPTGALIGKLGSHLLKIGNSLTFISEDAGYLLLRINDADIGLYDNADAITVEVTVHRLHAGATTIPTRTPSPIPPALPEKAVVDVYVMIFDPEVNGKPLTQQAGFTDPYLLIDAYIRDVQEVTNESVIYQIAQVSVIRTFPAKTGGFVYTNDQYWTCITSPAESAPEYCHRRVDYYAVVNTRYDLTYMSVCEAVANDGIDEVWEWEGGWLGFREFYVVAPYTLCPGVGKEFTFMTFNYSRGMAEALHSLGHRVESILQRELGVEVWDRFDGQRWRYAQDYNLPPVPDLRHPEVDVNNAHCGNVHFPPNAYLHYQYDRDFPVRSDCDRWLHYPDLDGPQTILNCDAWGCEHYGFLKWWLSHIPHNPGDSRGIYHNWWKYVFPFGDQ